MLDRTIPFYNTIMKCEGFSHRENILPEGFSIASYQPGYEKEWARLEYSTGDFESPGEAENYFVETYLIQVAYSVAEDKTYEREFSAFSNIDNTMKKIIITSDDIDYSTSTVYHYKLKDFLMMDEL